MSSNHCIRADGTEAPSVRAGRFTQAEVTVTQVPLSKLLEIDPDWQEKIQQAKQAREETRNARKGKLLVFPANRLIPLAQAVPND